MRATSDVNAAKQDVYNGYFGAIHLTQTLVKCRNKKTSCTSNGCKIGYNEIEKLSV